MQTAIMVTLGTIAVGLVIWIAYDIGKRGDFSYKDGIAVLGIIATITGIVVTWPHQSSTPTSEPVPTVQLAVQPTTPIQSNPPTAIPPTATATPTATPKPPTATPTSTATPVPSTPTRTPPPPVVRTIQVPGNQENGVRFDSPSTSTYHFTIVDGAYSAWTTDSPQGGMWRTIIHIYKNRPIEWGWRAWGNEKYNEPINPDYKIGLWNFDAQTTQEQAASAGKGETTPILLATGDYLILVPIDERTAYNYPAPNRGRVTIEIW